MNESRPAAGGFLILDKPRGVSSFQALAPLKRAFRGLKVGHAGTLDPAASGLLLVGIGAGTRLLEYLEGMPKTYSFTARFGITSDSYDMEGETLPAGAAGALRAAALSAEAVEKALPPFRGRILQVPPAYSAIKVDGRRAYDLARAGETVTLAAREVEVHALELRGFSPDGPIASLEMTCSKGTYVRTLVHDLGQALGCGAVADDIRRLAIGPFRVESAVSPADASPENLLPLEAAVAHLPAAVLAAHRVAALFQGKSTAPGGYTLDTPIDFKPGARPIDPAAAAPIDREAAASDASIDPTAAAAPAAADPEYRVLDPGGRFLAIATLSPEGSLCPKKVLTRN